MFKLAACSLAREISESHKLFATRIDIVNALIILMLFVLN